MHARRARRGKAADQLRPSGHSTDAAGDPTVIVSTDGEYSYVGRLVVDFNRRGILQSQFGGRLRDLSGIDLGLNGPVRTEDSDVIALWGSLDAATGSSSTPSSS